MTVPFGEFLFQIFYLEMKMDIVVHFATVFAGTTAFLEKTRSSITRKTLGNPIELICFDQGELEIYLAIVDHFGGWLKLNHLYTLFIYGGGEKGIQMEIWR